MLCFPPKYWSDNTRSLAKNNTNPTAIINSEASIVENARYIEKTVVKKATRKVEKVEEPAEEVAE